MAKKFLSYLKLTWLCFSLSFEILIFGLSYLLLKVNQKKALAICLTLLVLISLITNAYVFNKKSTPQVKLNQVQAINYSQDGLANEKVILEKAEIEERLEFYQKIEQVNIKNLGLLLNLNQLNKALSNDELAQEYLDRAKEILPSINYLEN